MASRRQKNAGFLLPDELPSDTCNVSFCIPNSPELKAAVRGQLWQLGKYYMWERTSGKPLAVDAAQLFRDALENTYCEDGGMPKITGDGCSKLYVQNCGDDAPQLVLDLSCLAGEINTGNTTIAKAIQDDLQGLVDSYLNSGRDWDALITDPQWDTITQTQRDLAMCMAAQMLVTTICEAELQRREDAEQSSLELIGTLVAGAIAVIFPLAGAPVIAAIVAAVATRIFAGIFAQLHVIASGDLRSGIRRRATACCLYSNLEGLSGNLFAGFQAAANCADTDALPGVLQMLTDDTIFVGFAKAAMELIPAAKAGVAVCACTGVTPDGTLVLMDTFTGIIGTGATVELGTVIDPLGPFGGAGLETVEIANPSCNAVHPHYREATFTCKIALMADAYNMFAQTVARHNYQAGASVGAEMAHIVEFWDETDTTLVLSSVKVGAKQSLDTAYHYVGQQVGALPAGVYVVRVRLTVCTDYSTYGQMLRLYLFGNYDGPEYDSEVAV